MTIQQRPIAANFELISKKDAMQPITLDAMQPITLGEMQRITLDAMVEHSAFAAMGRCWIVTEKPLEIRHVVHSDNTFSEGRRKTCNLLHRTNVAPTAKAGRLGQKSRCKRAARADADGRVAAPPARSAPAAGARRARGGRVLRRPCPAAARMAHAHRRGRQRAEGSGV